MNSEYRQQINAITGICKGKVSVTKSKNSAGNKVTTTSTTKFHRGRIVNISMHIEVNGSGIATRTEISITSRKWSCDYIPDHESFLDTLTSMVLAVDANELSDIKIIPACLRTLEAPTVRSAPENEEPIIPGIAGAYMTYAKAAGLNMKHVGNGWNA